MIAGIPYRIFPKLLHEYLVSLNRLSRFNEEQLQRFQEKKLRKIIRFANTVPLYHSAFKKAGITPSDIKTIEDISKLPCTTKEDIISNTPQSIVSSTIPSTRLQKISTSGTSGKQLSLFVDITDIIIGILGYLRCMQAHGIQWRSHRLSIIGDFASHTAETGYIKKGFFSNSKLFKNFQWLDTNKTPDFITKQLTLFQPDFLGGYAGMLGHLALLKYYDKGPTVHPKVIFSTGSVLDPALKQFIEKQFQAPVFEAYGATEAGPIAFQCSHQTFHIMSDLVYVEVLQDEEHVSSKQPGHIVITKLYGKGTPFIRYTAVNDIVAPRYNKTCSCGLSGQHLWKIYGRDDIALFFKGGKVMLASSIAAIFSRLLSEVKTTSVHDTQVVQPDSDTINISLVFDKKEQITDQIFKDICYVLQQGFKEKVGSSVQITIEKKDSLTHTGPRIQSRVKPVQCKDIQYI